jgi:hypothetical protein
MNNCFSDFFEYQSECQCAFSCVYNVYDHLWALLFLVKFVRRRINGVIAYVLPFNKESISYFIDVDYC